MTRKKGPADEFNDASLATRAGIRLARKREVWGAVEDGRLVTNIIDNEGTDKTALLAGITASAIKSLDLAYNKVGEHLIEVRVPDRITVAAKAAQVTRYFVSKLRSKDRLPPHIAVAKIIDTVQKSPRRLWDMLGEEWRQKLGEELWRRTVDERVVEVPSSKGVRHPVLVRHYPLLDEDNQVVRHVRIHEPKPGKDEMMISMLAGPGERSDYTDETGSWRLAKFDKTNKGYNNISYDHRQIAAEAFRANIPHKEIHALNKKVLGNHANDVRWNSIGFHFFSTKEREILKLGTRIDPEIDEERISAKEDLLMAANLQFADADVGLTEGVRLYDDTLPNEKRGHNEPQVDNDKTIGLDQWQRRVDPDLLTHFERSGQIDTFRDFLTRDIEDGNPTTNPLRFIVATSGDKKTYRAVPLIILGSDDEQDKRNRVWGMRADIDYSTYTFEPGGKLIPEMTPEEIAHVEKTQRGTVGAVFHQVKVKEPHAVVSLEQGQAAGYYPTTTKQTFRNRRDFIADYIAEDQNGRDVSFLTNAIKGLAMGRAMKPAADTVPLPYGEEEIHTGMRRSQYEYVDVDGEKIPVPAVIIRLKVETYERLNEKMGDPMRQILRPQPMEFDAPTVENARAYMKLRDKQQAEFARQAQGGDCPILPPPRPVVDDDLCYDDAFIVQAYNTMLADKLYLMDKVQATTTAYDVQQLIGNGSAARWQTIPWKTLSDMPETELNRLNDDGRLRVNFEPDPNRLAYRFAVRAFIEDGAGALLPPASREFYEMETANLVHGPPFLEPSEHRIASARMALWEVEQELQNIRPGSAHLSAARDNETGEYELFAGQDLGDAILMDIKADSHRRLREHLLTDARKFAFGIDPATDRPMLQPRYEITGEPLVIKMPDGFAVQAASHAEFGHTSFILPRTPGLTQARHIVLEEESTGRRYYAAEPAVQELPSRAQGRYNDFYRIVDQPYENNGKAAPATGWVLSCAELAPIMRDDPRATPAIGILQDKLLATRAPHLGHLNRDEPLSGFAVRKYDLELVKGQAIRLRGKDANDMDTGWEGQVTVTRLTELTMAQLLDMMDDPAQQGTVDRLAFVSGYGSAEDLKAHKLAEFTKFSENVRDPKNVLMFVEFSMPARLDYWTPKQPRAAYAPKPPEMAPPVSPSTAKKTLSPWLRGERS